MKNSTKSEQSQAGLSFAERMNQRSAAGGKANFRPKVKKTRLLTLLALLLTAATGAWAEDTTVFELSGSTASTGTLTLGTTSVEAGTVKIHNNKDEINAIKMSSNYNYADGKYFTIKPATGSFKKGDKLSIAICFNNNDDTKNAKAAIYAADHETLLYTTENGINGRTNVTDDPAVEEYVLTQDADLLYIGRSGNTTTFVTMLKVVRPESVGGDGDGTYTVKMKDGVKDADKWGAKIADGYTKALPFEGVPEGATLRLTYSGRLKVKGVKATTDAQPAAKAE
jgi:hypothetical protein